LHHSRNILVYTRET